jgi:hypothetical protein
MYCRISTWEGYAMREHTIGWTAGSIYFLALLLLDWIGAGLMGMSLFVVAYSLLLFLIVPRIAAQNSDCEHRHSAHNALRSNGHLAPC